MSLEGPFESLPGCRVRQHSVTLQATQDVRVPIENAAPSTLSPKPVQGCPVDQDRRLFKNGQPGVVKAEKDGISES